MKVGQCPVTDDTEESLACVTSSPGSCPRICYAVSHDSCQKVIRERAEGICAVEDAGLRLFSLKKSPPHPSGTMLSREEKQAPTFPPLMARHHQS